MCESCEKAWKSLKTYIIGSEYTGWRVGRISRVCKAASVVMHRQKTLQGKCWAIFHFSLLLLAMVVTLTMMASILLASCH